MTRHDDLREAAAKATPGTWIVNGKQSVRGSDGEYIAKANWRNGVANATFIGLANPSRITEILDELERYRAGLLSLLNVVIPELEQCGGVHTPETLIAVDVIRAALSEKGKADE